MDEAQVQQAGEGRATWQPLDPRYVPYLRLSGGIRVGIEVLALATVVPIAFADGWLTPALLRVLTALLAALVVLDAVVVAWMPPLTWRHASWRVDERGVEIRRGVWWRTCVAVPRTRIQHLDVTQGPIERGYDLGTLVLHTAGTADASVALEGLAHETALALRDDLAAWTKVQDGV